MNSKAGAEVVAGMATYYARRAAEYEAVYFKPERQTDLRRMEAELAAPFAGRSAAGGHRTARVRPRAGWPPT